MTKDQPTSNKKSGIKPKLYIIAGAIVVIIAGLFYFSKTSNAAKLHHDIDPAFGEFVSAYTAGVISKEATIRIRLAEEFQDSTQIGQGIEGNLFKFSPAIEGSAYWTDAKTIEFKPNSPLTSGTTYTGIFHLAELIDVPDALREFEFSFKTMAQNFDLIIGNLEAKDIQKLENQQLHGQVITADIADNQEVESILSAFQGTSNLEITWDHASDQRTHNFLVENIIRKEKSASIKLSFNGKSLAVDRSGEEMVEVPALGDFKLTNSKVVHNPEQYVSLTFSDPIQKNQNLDGLITVGNVSGLKFIVNKNEIQIFPPVRQSGTIDVHLFSGIKNINGHRLKKEKQLSLAFEQLHPAVKLVGKGVILPNSEGLVLPFEAVNLKAVEVKITKIYEKNLSQFLQVNNFEGSRELRRVGRPVVKKTIQLNNQGISDLGKWNRFTLDLTNIIAKEPGALYQVQLSFNKSHSAYNCPGSSIDEESLGGSVEENWDEAQEEELSYWDSYDDYYYDPNYDWQERDNPCHSSYYAYGRGTIAKNIIASNLGIIAKLGNNRKMVLTVTDMLTTTPLQGVDVEIYDFQHQLITASSTDGNGFMEAELEKKPFLIIAKHNGEKGYLKVDDGNTLSLSNFDVSGNVIQKGIKGFFYGERGVWRPGDDIYLTFILEDVKKQLPEKHPVIFELRNPKGQITQKMVKTSSVGGMYHFATKTNQDDLTGNWLASVKVGGVNFDKTLKIETIKPNRLKINLDFGREKIAASDSDITGKLEVNWLHGAPARNLKAEFDVVLNQTKTSFSKYANFTFDDPTRTFYAESQRIYDGRLNEQGESTISTTLSTSNDAPGMLMANFKGKVFESGGGFSIDRFSIPYYPYESFIGISTPKGDKARGMLLTDTTHSVKIATVDANGNPVSRNDIDVSLYKLEWRWWWENSTQNIANYFGRTRRQPIANGKTTTRNGKGSWEFKISYPEWGRYLIRACDPVSGHCTGKVIYIDWPGWAGRAQREFPGGASMLSFSADKENYTVGEDVKLTIPSRDDGRALISIENGSGIIKQEWIKTTKGETPYIFSVTEDMAPNVYVNVSLVQPHAQTTNDLPMRLYGIIGLGVENPNTRLQPEITMADELEPEQEVSIEISEADGKAMAYSIAIVDEGLLDLTRFKTPDAWNAFYAKEALGVKTWDIFDDVIGAYGGRMERLLAIGGDGTGAAEENAKVNRFKPVVTYLGPFLLQPNEKKKHSFTMPQYIGSVKTMVVAGYEGSYGNAEKITPVRQPLMVLGTLPRVLGPGESVTLPANVFVSDNKINQVAVKVTANNKFELNGANRKSISFNGPADQLVDFVLDVKPILGKGTVAIEANANGKTAKHSIEIEVRNPNPPVVDVYNKVLPVGESWQLDFNPPGMPGTNSATLEVYSIPPINLEKRLRYLLAYPHGCAEQTVSKAFPQLFLTDVTEINDVGQQRIQQNINAAISNLQKYQNGDGGFSYWPGEGSYDNWTTSYIGHFLVEAQELGYQIPGEMLRKWKQYQRKASREWRRNKSSKRSSLMQAYRLYSLALAGSPEKGAMNRLRSANGLENEAKWRLAAAYQSIGQTEAAKNLIQNANTTVPVYQELSYTFGSQLRDKAMILETLTMMGEKEKSFTLMREIAESLSKNNYWMSTQTTSFCLIAASKYIKTSKPEGGIAYSYRLNNQGAKSSNTNMAIAQEKLALNDSQNSSLQVSNTSKQQLYARLVLEGIPAVGDKSDVAENLNLNITYKDINGNSINPERIEQGTSFVAEVTVINPGLQGNYKELALTQIFPSGWEISNTRLEGIAYVNRTDQPQYQDIRDDRVYTYFGLDAGKRKTFRIMLNASYTGRFYLPTVYCEAMYNQSINARKPGKWVEVVKSGIK